MNDLYLLQDELLSMRHGEFVVIIANDSIKGQDYKNLGHQTKLGWNLDMVYQVGSVASIWVWLEVEEGSFYLDYG